MITPEQVFTLGMILDEIKKDYPNLKFWNGIDSHEVYDKTKSYKHRQGMPNEIRIEFDNKDRDKNWGFVAETSWNLWHEGYSFAVFSVEGGRSPHIHLYNIDELDNLSIEKRTEYRKKFLAKVCPIGSNPDLGLCDETHLCALEFVPHFKYGKVKALLHYFWQGKNQGCDYDILCQVREFKQQLSIWQQKSIEGHVFFPNQPFKDKVESLLTFEKVFDRYGIKYKGKAALCPFHNDTNYSLAFNNEKKLFHCFGTGCNVKGKILTLIKLLEKKKYG